MKIPEYLILLFFIVILPLCSQGCKQQSTEPDPGTSQDTTKINYVIKPQHDIPWKSLANSDWPIALHDAQCTGRSSFIGPSQGTIKNTILLSEYTTDPVIGSDSILYITSDTSLYSITLSGVHLWKKYIGTATGIANYNSPVIIADGTIVVAADEGISAFKNDGTLLWNTKISGRIVIKSCGVDLNGNIYVISLTGTLYCISKYGNILWQKNAPEGVFRGNSQSTISFAPDGNKFYIGGSAAQGSLYTISTSGDILRSDSLGSQSGAISVDVDGNVFSYFGGNLVSVSPSGKVRWRKEDSVPNWNITIDPYGNIAYLSAGKLILVDNNGQVRWRVPVNQTDYITHLVCDVNGTIYIETSDDFTNYDVQAVSNTGNILWTVRVPAYVKEAGPALTKNGYLLFPHSGYYPSPKVMYVIE